jgi:hypothetical protein
MHCPMIALAIALVGWRVNASEDRVRPANSNRGFSELASSLLPH